MRKILSAGLIAVAIFLQGFICKTDVYAQTTNNAVKTYRDISLSGDAISYLEKLGWQNFSSNSSQNLLRVNMLKQFLYSILTKNNSEDLDKNVADKSDVANAVFAMIQVQRANSKFAVSVDKDFFSSFPDKKIVKGFDKGFNKKSGGVIFDSTRREWFVLNNPVCISDKSENDAIAKQMGDLPMIIAPVGLILMGMNQMTAVNIFGETVAIFDENTSGGSAGIATVNSAVKSEKNKSSSYRIQMQNNFVSGASGNMPLYVNFDTGKCQPNELAEAIEKTSKWVPYKYFLQVNKVFFDVADAMYLFLSWRLLAIMALVLGLRFIYTFGVEHYKAIGESENGVDYKSYFFNFIRVKAFKIVLFLFLLWVPPSIIIRWTVEPVMLMGITLSKEILTAGGAIKNKKMCNDSVLAKSMQDNIPEQKKEFIAASNVILPKTEKLIDGENFIDIDGRVKNHKSEKDIIITGYTSSILCNIYEISDYISKHAIVGQQIAKLAFKEIFFPSPKSTGGIVQSVFSSPITYIIIAGVSGFTGMFGIWNLLIGIITPLISSWQHTLTFFNLFIFGGFVFVSMILFNFMLFLQFLELCIGLGVIIMKIPLMLIIWLFKDENNINVSFSEFFGELKKNAISIASISFIVVFMMTFMEYVYYNLLGIPVGAIDKAFQYGRVDLITKPIMDYIISGQSTLHLAFLDILLMILTFWYVSKNMGMLLGMIGGNTISTDGFVKGVKEKISGMWKKVSVPEVINLAKSKTYNAGRDKMDKK